MKFDVLDMNGKKVSDIELSDAVFGLTPNEKVMHAAVVNFLANQRQGTQSTKTRSEVSGGGRKPWRQKGTGRARQGSTRSPQWTHGGVALGPKPRDYSYRLNKKVKRLAVLSALSSKAQSGDMIVLDKIEATEYKTKTIANMLKAVGVTKKALIVTPAVDAKLVKSAANIPGVKTTAADCVNTYEVLNGGKFVISVDAAKKLEEVFA
ncbi:MAG TPA: 50S ribosomal protein L4 [Candidatus Ruthenibacterium avium]|uniref:Large ribosomal subunit protein uL4 n=1 Tax=Candidatus Ruthenibacterium avium TaxID=2838751 RepID=A0A9D2M4D1_9FIRM|nr:50S ribosomal protein L4 [Candidatus Ruthenibacterium avium]